MLTCCTLPSVGRAGEAEVAERPARQQVDLMTGPLLGRLAGVVDLPPPLAEQGLHRPRPVANPQN